MSKRRRGPRAAPDRLDRAIAQELGVVEEQVGIIRSIIGEDDVDTHALAEALTRLRGVVRELDAISEHLGGEVSW